jgi:integrase
MSSIRKRGDTFTITAYFGYDEKGKQIRKTTTFKPPKDVTSGKAEKLANEYAVLWENRTRGYPDLDENKTVRQLVEWFFETQAEFIMRKHVATEERKKIECHIMPYIGNIKIKACTPQVLDNMFKDIYENGFAQIRYKLKDRALFDGYNRRIVAETVGIDRATFQRVLSGQNCRIETAEKLAAFLKMPFDKVFENSTKQQGLSSNTLHHLRRSFSACFSIAVKKRIIKENPLSFVSLPKKSKKPSLYLDEKQSRTLLEAVHKQDDFQFEVIVNLFLASGLRCGELIALQWADIDFENSMLYVRHNHVKTVGGHLIEPPKTEKSERRIKLPLYIMRLLEKHKETQVFHKLGMVFTSKSGDYIADETIREKLKRICRQEGLPDIGVHSLRHTYASLLINADVAVKTISELLGHSVSDTTLNVYSHIFEETKARALKAVEMKLFNEPEYNITVSNKNAENKAANSG